MPRREESDETSRDHERVMTHISCETHSHGQNLMVVQGVVVVPVEDRNGAILSGDVNDHRAWSQKDIRVDHLLEVEMEEERARASLVEDRARVASQVERNNMERAAHE